MAISGLEDGPAAGMLVPEDIGAVYLPGDDGGGELRQRSLQPAPPLQHSANRLLAGKTKIERGNSRSSSSDTSHHSVSGAPVDNVEAGNRGILMRRLGEERHDLLL